MFADGNIAQILMSDMVLSTPLAANQNSCCAQFTPNLIRGDGVRVASKCDGAKACSLHGAQQS